MIESFNTDKRKKQIEEIIKESILVGDTILQFGKGKKTFGSFVKNNNESINDIFPYIEQALWAVPMGDGVWFDNNHEDLSKISDYDMPVVFVHEYGENNNVKTKIDGNKIYVIVSSIDNKNLGDMFFYVWTNIMNNNHFLYKKGKE